MGQRNMGSDSAYLRGRSAERARQYGYRKAAEGAEQKFETEQLRAQLAAFHSHCVPDTEYQKVLNHIGHAKAEIKRLEAQLRAVISERDGHRGYVETVTNLREENERLKSEIGILATHVLVVL